MPVHSAAVVADLTIRDLAERPAILTRHADGSVALLRKARAVENQDACRARAPRAAAVARDRRPPTAPR